MNSKIWLSSPHMGGSELNYIHEAFDSNWIAPLGPNLDAFESAIAGYCGISHVAVLNSGTAALHLALSLMGVGSGDEVFAPSFTFSATINPIIYVGATPVLIDSEPDTWNMNPEILEKAIKKSLSAGRKPKAILPVHLYGMPARMDRIMEIASRYNLVVIEDAAEAMGSRFNGRAVGTFGKLGVLSFNGNKIITTSGGGALLSDDDTYITKARFLSTQARDTARHYQHSQIGYNYRMSNVLAGIGRGQMEVLDQRVKQRRDNYVFYESNLGDIDGVEFLKEPDRSFFSNHWLTTLIIHPEKTHVTRERLIAALGLENIETRPLWKPMHLQPIFSSCPSYIDGTSEKLFRDGLCLPSGSNLSDDDRNRVLTTILRCLKK